jgi:hypothetical protein
VSGYGPEFIRALLADIDAKARELEAVILEGSVPSWEAYRAMAAERRGLLKARALVVDRCDRETRQLLGIPADAPQRRRAPS